MKKLIIPLSLIINPIFCFAQYYNERMIDIVGVADGDEVVESLKIGLPVVIIGFLIAYFSMWSKSAQKKSDTEGSSIGCIGFIIILIGLFLLMPLWTWVEAIGLIIVAIISIIAIICLVIYLFTKH